MISRIMGKRSIGDVYTIIRKDDFIPDYRPYTDIEDEDQLDYWCQYGMWYYTEGRWYTGTDRDNGIRSPMKVTFTKASGSSYIISLYVEGYQYYTSERIRNTANAAEALSDFWKRLYSYNFRSTYVNSSLVYTNDMIINHTAPPCSTIIDTTTGEITIAIRDDRHSLRDPHATKELGKLPHLKNKRIILSVVENTDVNFDQAWKVGAIVSNAFTGKIEDARYYDHVDMNRATSMVLNWLHDPKSIVANERNQVWLRAIP